MEKRKVIYIAGPITGIEDYYEHFCDMEFELARRGNLISLSPAALPPGMSRAQYMRICFGMIDSADAVILLDGWRNSLGAKLEQQYCEYIGKPCFERLGELLEALEEMEVVSDEAREEADQGTEKPAEYCRVQPRRVVSGAGFGKPCCVRIAKR